MKKNKCNCIEQLNEQLRPMNAAIDVLMMFDFKERSGSLVMQIPLRKIDSTKRKPLPSIAVTFCPVCGKRVHTVRKKLSSALGKRV